MLAHDASNNNHLSNSTHNTIYDNQTFMHNFDIYSYTHLLVYHISVYIETAKVSGVNKKGTKLSGRQYGQSLAIFPISRNKFCHKF